MLSHPAALTVLVLVTMYADAATLQGVIHENEMSGSNARLTTILNNLGDLDRDQNRRDEARWQYEEALKINRELAEKNPGAYLPEVATTLNNLGNLSRDQNRLDEARRQFEEALEIYESPAIKIKGGEQFILDAEDVKRQLKTLPSKKGS
jgi:tetratricopeptide (TPR) repeat protein